VRRYTEAMKSLENFSLHSRDATVRAFIKKEKLTKFSPRVISPRDPRFLLELGCYIKPIEHKVYHALSKLRRCFTGEVVAKGLNAMARGSLLYRKWKNFRNPVAISWDQKKFDAHVRVMCLKYENSIFEAFYTGEHRTKLSRLLSMCLVNKFRAYFPDGSVKYTVEGGRCSGDVQTSLGAIVIVVSMFIAYFDDCSISKFDILDDGDDIVTICEEDDLIKLLPEEEWFARCGFRVTKGKPTRILEQIEFCHAHPIEYSQNEYVMVRNFPDNIPKDFTCLSSVGNTVQLLSWFNAIGDCGLSLTKKIPVLSSFYEMLKRNGKGATCKIDFFADSGFALMAKGMSFNDGVIEDCSRLSFYKAFNLIPETQILLEQHYRQMNFDVVMPSN